MSVLHRAAAAAMVLCAATPLALAQQGEATAAPVLRKVQQKQRELVDARVDLIEPISVNGVEIPPDQIRRQAVFLVGAKTVEAKIAEFFIAEQLEIAVEEQGRDPEEFEISEDELLEGVRDHIEEFQDKNPGVGFYEAVRAQYGVGKEQFLQQRRQAMLFDRLFFPGPAEEWPPITREAIMASSQGGDGKAFWDSVVQASVDEEGNARELPPFWMQLCRGWVQRQLKSWSDIRFPSDGLEPAFCLEVNDRRLRTEQAFEEIREGLYVQDLERAVAEVAIREALRQELVEQGVYLSDEEFRAEFDEYRAEFDGTPFNTEVIATSFKGYPSLEAFRARWRLIRSFEKLIAEEMTDEALQQHADEYGSFFADGQVNVDYIQFLGRNLKTGAWAPNGMERARERAAEAWELLESEEQGFEEVKEEYGEFYANDENQGRLGSKSLNQIRQNLRESEFTDLLVGYSVGDFIYYDAEPGQVYGPMRSTDAYYIVRINSRTPARSAVSIAEERTKELVRQDYVSRRFLAWANEVVAAAEIQ